MIDKEATIFYSWQSDDKKVRNYIERSLKAAISSLNTDPDLELAPRMDKDTQGTTGAIEIARTILAKIDKCDVFLADVTVIGENNSRSLVNQNVLFELGYAIARKGNENVILVANHDTTDVEKLPFDIKGWRVALFSMSKDPKGENFARELESIIHNHLATVDTEKELDNTLAARDSLIDAIEYDKPTRSKAELYIASLYERLIEMAPPRYRGTDNINEYGKLVYDQYASTKPVIEDYAELIALAAEYKDRNTLVTAFKKLDMISKFYEATPEDNGQLYMASIEYYSLVCNELLSLLFGYLTKEELWDLIAEIKSIRLKNTRGYEDNEQLRGLYYLPEVTIGYFHELKQQKYSVPMSIILQDRWDSNLDILHSYVDGSLFIYLTEERYFPWTAGLLVSSSWKEFLPEYIRLFKKQSFITKLSEITGENNVDLLKAKMIKRIQLQIISNISSYHYHNLTHLFKNSGINAHEDLGSTSS